MEVPLPPSYHRLMWITHSLFWLGYLCFAGVLLAAMLPLEKVVLRILLTGIFHAALVYANLLWLMPRYFEQGRFGGYAVWALLLVGLNGAFRLLTDVGLSQVLEVSPQLESYLLTPQHVAGILLTSLLVLIVTSPIRLVHNWHIRRHQESKQQAAQLAAEVGLLRTQLNPHFLFNVLNNLYGLALTDSDMTAPSILKLAGMMRYMLYDTQSEWVQLSQELVYLTDYIELQQLKTEFTQDIRWEVGGPLGDWKIPPLLFLPLLENAFKHGNLDQEQTGWLSIKVAAAPDRLTCMVENSFLPNRPKDKVGGIGLQNIKQRLKLYFPDHHQFDLQSGPDTFKASLILHRIDSLPS